MKSVGDFFSSKPIKIILKTLLFLIILIIVIFVVWTILLNAGRKNTRKVKYRPLTKKELKEFEDEE
jgi:hypothetical protein